MNGSNSNNCHIDSSYLIAEFRFNKLVDKNDVASRVGLEPTLYCLEGNCFIH